MERKEDILVCRCGDVSHQLVFSYWEEDDMRDVFVTMYLAKLPLWKRIVEGVRYIFGKKSKYGAFEEIILHEADADKVQKVADYLKSIKEEINA